MLIHNHPLFRIYFGDSKDELFAKDYAHLPEDKNICELAQFARLKKLLQLETFVFLHQVHGAQGLVIDSMEQAKKIKNFSIKGDYLVTNVKRVGIGVMTADCLSIVFFDKRNQALGIAHAGWRGSVKQIAAKVIGSMQESFGTRVDDLTVFFGSSAKVCCYKVSDSFIENIEDFEFLDRVLQRRSDGLYFDLPLFNVAALEELGVKKGAIQLKYNDCTMCESLFFSYRCDGKEGGQQMTVACLT